MSATTARRPRAQQRRKPSRGPDRATVLRRRAVAVMSVVTVVVLGYALWFTSLVGVGEVAVEGNVELTAEQVRVAAEVGTGEPILSLDTDAVAAKVRELPRVADVEVSRSLPGTVLLRVTERTPVAVVQADDGAHLVDRTGKDYATTSAAPAGLPVLKGTGEEALASAVSVLVQLPDDLRREVLSVGSSGGTDLVLEMSAGREVRWGSAQDTPRKAAVLDVLLTREGKVYDVTSPELPTVS